MAGLLLFSACATVAVVQDPEPVAPGVVRGGGGLAAMLDVGEDVSGAVVPEVDLRLGLGKGFDTGLRLTPLEFSWDLKGLMYSKEGFAASLSTGVGIGADPSGSTGEERAVWATARVFVLVRYRRGQVSFYGGPQVTFGPRLTGTQLEDTGLLTRGGGFLGLGLFPSTGNFQTPAFFVEIQAGATRFQPVAGEVGSGHRTGLYMVPAVAFSWDLARREGSP